MKINNTVKNILFNIVIPAFIFAVITIVFNFTIVSGFTKYIERNDGRLLAWTLAWDNHKLLHDPLNIFKANIFYPNENTLTYSEHAFAISLFTLPAHILSKGNPIIGFNFAMLLFYFLNAFTSYLLVKHLTKSRMAGILAGIIFGFCSYRVLNFGHLQNMPVFYMPLMLLFMYKYFEDEKKIKYLIGIGACLLLQSLSSWYHMIFIFFLFGCFILYFILKKRFQIPDLKKFVITLIVVFAFIIPFALPYLEFNKKAESAYNMNELKTYSSDFGGYLLPSPNTFEHTQILSRLNIKKTNWQENFNYIGMLPLLLTLLAFVKVENKKASINLSFSKSKAVFVLTGLLFTLLSFGPFLRFADVTTKIPLLYLIIYKLVPPIRFIRAVARFSTVTYLMLAIMSAFGLLVVFKKLKYKPITYFIFLFIAGFVAFEYFPYEDYREYENVENIPEVYETVKNNSDVKAIVEYPINVGPFTTTGYVYYAGYHLKPLVNGYSGYQPADYPKLINILEQFPDTIGLVKLKEMGVTHILVNPTYDKKLSEDYLELIKESDHYRLYAIKDNIDDLKFYYTNFDEGFSQNFDELLYTKNNVEFNKPEGATYFSNVSPVRVDEEGLLEIYSKTDVNKLTINFRTYSKDDYIEVTCAANESYSFSNTSDYLDYNLELPCHTNEINIRMYSTEFRDRSLISNLALE